MMENGLENLVIPQHLAIDSMKDSGYKNTAYAIAELVDNSIQAGESTDGKTEVEIILLEKKIRHPNRITKQIDKIAVYDNACGMDKETLRLALQFGGGTRKKAFEGIGKFGMGLPNSSISQCNKLEVWSWQNNEIYYCYIDTEEISRGKMQEVPLPERQDKIPIDIRNKITGKIKASGTLIVWSELERLTWKRHNAFFKHTEILIGRMYRYFIAENQCSIRMIAYDDDEVLENSHVRANDPLFLMKNTIAPAPYDKEPAFEQYGEVISISGNHYGENGEIKLTFSIVKQSVRLEGGGSSIGKMALSNQGVSVVRAGRELEINKSFENSYDPRERWWGVEVRFDPVFDEVFGVTNNKQMATNFYKLDYASLAEGEDITVAELKTLLEEDHDSRKIIIDISTKIDSVLQTIKNQIKKQREGIKQTENANDSSSHTPENIGSTIVKERKNDNPSPSDLQEDEIPLDQKKEELEGIIEDSLNINDPQDREAIIQKWLSNKFIVLSKSLPVASFFDVSFPAGKIQITINSEHSAFQYFFEKLEDENHEIYQILKLILMAWGRMEDEAQGNRERKRLLQDLRYDWGKIARDMIERYEE